jgi:hypothetical protein
MHLEETVGFVEKAVLLIEICPATTFKSATTAGFSYRRDINLMNAEEKKHFRITN